MLSGQLQQDRAKCFSLYTQSGGSPQTPGRNDDPKMQSQTLALVLCNRKGFRGRLTETRSLCVRACAHTGEHLRGYTRGCWQRADLVIFKP